MEPEASSMRLDLYPPPGQPSNPPTWEDIETLAVSYPVLHHAVTLVERGDMTREQALIAAVFALAGAFQKLFQERVDSLMRDPGPRTFVVPPVAEAPSGDARSAVGKSEPGNSSSEHPGPSVEEKEHP